MMEKDFHKKFDQCPNCGSPRQFLKELSQELKDRGLARPEWNMRYDSRSGPVIDESRQMLLPIGGKVPGFTILTDICMECGTIYAVELHRIEAQLRATQRLSNQDPDEFFGTHHN